MGRENRLGDPIRVGGLGGLDDGSEGGTGHDAYPFALRVSFRSP